MTQTQQHRIVCAAMRIGQRERERWECVCMSVSLCVWLRAIHNGVVKWKLLEEKQEEVLQPHVQQRPFTLSHCRLSPVLRVQTCPVITSQSVHWLAMLCWSVVFGHAISAVPVMERLDYPLHSCGAAYDFEFCMNKFVYLKKMVVFCEARSKVLNLSFFV